MRRHSLTICVASIITLIGLTASAVAADDPTGKGLSAWVGEWKVVKASDVRLSGTREGTAGGTMKIEPWEDGLSVVQEGVPRPDGSRFHVDYKFKPDGKDYAESGATNRTVTGQVIGPLSFTRIDDRTLVRRDKPGDSFGDQFHRRFTWVLSGNGKYLTITYVDTSLDEPFGGVTICQRQVFDKQ